MKIKRILNNNAVICLNEKGQEIIAMGCGIAFSRKQGDSFPDNKIEQIFVPKDDKATDRLTELVSSVPHEVIMCSEKIIAMATDTGMILDDSIHITLTDHIYGAVERYRKGIKLSCPLRWDIDRMYAKEYGLAMSALALIHQNLGVMMEEDEAGFIALHLINGQIGGEQGIAEKVTQIIGQILTLVKDDLHIRYREDTLYYERFLSHLKFFAQRVASGKRTQETDQLIVDAVKNAYPDSYRVCRRVRAVLESSYNYCMSPDDMTYLTIHIERIRTEGRTL